MAYFTHLECSVPCGARPFDPREPPSSLLLRRTAARTIRSRQGSRRGRATASTVANRTCGATASCCRCSTAKRRSRLGEGFTPLFHARALGATLGLDAPVHQGRIAEPDQLVQGARPVGRDYAREVRSARKRSPLPTAGNAGNASRRLCGARRPGVRRSSFPRTRSCRSCDECRLYGANVTLVDGLITDAGRIAAEKGGPLGWYDVSTLKEPYRIEGKKTMAYELAEQMDWQ